MPRPGRPKKGLVPIDRDETKQMLSHDSWRQMLQGSTDVETKIQAAHLYCIHGNTKKISRLTGVPRQTIQTWRRKPWWKELTGYIFQDKDDELKAKFTGLVHDSVDAIRDRVTKGNIKIVQEKVGVDENGEKIFKDVETRVPLSAREIAIAGLAVPFDKRAILTGAHQKSKEQTQQEFLSDLKDVFVAGAQAQKEVEKPVQGVVIEHE